MIHFKTGNILHACEEALVNPVNCVGVMGPGLALHFKRAFPDNFDAYVEALPWPSRAARSHVRVQARRHWVAEVHREFPDETTERDRRHRGRSL
jgi:O-acetyl-ADP-ribose deacetylase (regulator of RNase III)